MSEIVSSRDRLMRIQEQIFTSDDIKNTNLWFSKDDIFIKSSNCNVTLIVFVAEEIIWHWQMNMNVIVIITMNNNNTYLQTILSEIILFKTENKC